MRYIVLIDNGSDYAGELPGVFDSEEDADTAGDAWLEGFLFDNDIDPEDPDQPHFDLLPVTDTVGFKRLRHERGCTCADTWPALSEVCAEGMDAVELDEPWDMTRRL